jgi:hypothetical protein
MRYQTVNNLLGWTVFAVSLSVYTLTLEPSVSMWDCGEFITAAHKLQVVHQPGAPLFLMVARLFTLFSPDNEGVSVAVNMLSALCSALTVLFTFWITTYFAKRITANYQNDLGNRIGIFASGTVAALALTFSDTFWFSAVEAEVYAMSSFFTAFSFWAALKWESDTSPYAGKWLILISYMIGLSIGTHLLSLLVVPAVACIYYFKHFKYSKKGMLYCLLIGFGVLMIIQKIIIPGIPKILSAADLFFVNSLGFGFWIGALISLLFVAGLLAYGIYYFSRIKIRPHWNLACICLSYILLGYGSYAMVVIRSNEPLPIDMGNPEEPFNLSDYINRAQYEERPLLYGPHFNAKPVDVKVTGDLYRKDPHQYTHIGEDRKYVYDDAYNTFFPRMGDMQKDGSPSGYRYWSGMSEVSARIDELERSLQENKDPKAREEINTEIEQLKAEKPSMGNNLRFFFSYQINHMYIRYFMWNFAGRQNDRQGHSYNRYYDGNWISGIGPIDHIRLGPQEEQPEELMRNKGKNKFYFLPLALGILGFVIQFKRRRNDLIVNGIFFLFTGLLINIFLNQPPFEPRERDYVHVGSFQIFCIWIGLGVLWIIERLKRKMGHTGAALSAFAISMTAPAIMAQQGWDDHDRSKRYLAIDFARNYLNSCPPNAILLGNADNDTYPLWYAQNVEGIRKDVRIINQNLLPSDWYSQSLLTKVYDSEPLPLTLTKEQLAAGENDYFQYEGQAADNKPVDLRSFIKQLLQDRTGTYRQKQFTVKVNRQAALQAGVVRTDDSAQMADEIVINFPAGGIHKGHLVLLDLIARNAETGWKRPICFSTIAGNEGFINLEPYFERRGLIYQLVPVKSPVSNGHISRINTEDTYDLLMKQFRFSGMKEKPGFYLDDKSDVAASSLQQLFVALAAEYSNKVEEIKFYDSILNNQDNRAKVEAFEKKTTSLLDKCALEIPETVLFTKGNIKFNMAALRQETGNHHLAKKLLDETFETARQEVVYFIKFKGRPQDTDYLKSSAYEAFSMMKRCIEYGKKWGYTEGIAEKEKTVSTLEPGLNDYLSGP